MTVTSLPRTLYREQKRTWHQGFSTKSGMASAVKQVRTVTGKEQLVRTSGHAYRKLGRSTADIGGDFECVKHEYFESDTVPDYIQHTSPYYGRTGTFAWAKIANPGVGDFPPSPASNDATLHVIGTKMIKACIPTNPLAGLAVAVGEIREGIPGLVGADFFKSRTGLAKSAGSEYLNVQFGWIPLVSDVQAFSQSVTQRDEILREYERLSGKRIKRRLSWPTEKTTTVNVQNGQYAVGHLNSYLHMDPGVLTTTTTTSKRRWFSGCFTYYLEPQSGNSRKRNEQLASRLYGARLTPSVLWELAPWSWAADWFGNTGDVLHNISAFANDGLVMPYAYIMEESMTEVTYELQGCTYPITPNYPAMVECPPTYMIQTFRTTAKKRIRATPFGFGLNESTFSGRQAAIVAALGLSRS